MVKGFLDAMLAWPISTSVAKEYLTDDAAEEWSPDATIIYTALGQAREDGGTVTIPMRDAALLDESGGWRGAIGEDRSTLEFQMTVEDGEFRILDPMDALVVRATWFQERYRQASLYYFDPTAQVLVPSRCSCRWGSRSRPTWWRRCWPGHLRGCVTSSRPSSRRASASGCRSR